MNYNPNELHVMYCCSDLFAEVLAVSIVSLFENNKSFDSITVHVFDDKITEENKAKLNSISERYNRSINYIALPNPSKYFNDNRFTIKSLGHTYARLIVGDVCNNINRIICLDSDTMIFEDIHELWTTDLDGYYMAGVDDCMGAETMEKILGVPKENNHCNAGMFLMDLEQWRLNNLGEVFASYMVDVFNKNKPLSFYEEEVINNTIIEKIRIVSPKFDFMTVDAVFSYEEVLKFRKPFKYYSKEEMLEAKNKPYIVHTTTLFYVRRRIFEEKSDHPFRPQYLQFKSMTPWSGEICKISQRSFKNNMIKTFWHCMPRRMAIWLAAFVRNKIRPFLKKKRDDE